MKKILFKYCCAICLGLLITCATPTTSYAQCPMCKMSAEQNLKDGGTAGKGLNQGILYMFFMPYVIVGCIGFVWYKNRLGEEESVLPDSL